MYTLIHFIFIALLFSGFLLQNSALATSLEPTNKSIEDQEKNKDSIEKKIIQVMNNHIYNSRYDGIIGNKSGTKIIVQFFDYNCGYCRESFKNILPFISSNPDLKLISKEMPVLGRESEKIHAVSMAVHQINPEKYQEYHSFLMKSQGSIDEENAIKIAILNGINESRLRKEIENPDIAKAIKDNIDLARHLGIRGTPSYVIGDEVIHGMLSKESLNENLMQMNK